MAIGDEAYREGYRRAVEDARSTADVAAELGLKDRQIRNLIRTLDLPYARQIGRDWALWPEDVEALRQRPTDGRTTRWQQRDTP